MYSIQIRLFFFLFSINTSSICHRLPFVLAVLDLRKMTDVTLHRIYSILVPKHGSIAVYLNDPKIL